MLAASPLVSTREGLLEQVMEGLGEPAGRPRGLATWLEGFRTQTMTTPALSPHRVGRTRVPGSGGAAAAAADAS